MTLLPILWSALPKLQLDVDFKFLQLQLFVLNVRAYSNRIVGFWTQNKIPETHNSFSSERLPVTFVLTKSILFSRALKNNNECGFLSKAWTSAFLRYKQLFKPSGQPDVISWPPIDEFDWLQ